MCKRKISAPKYLYFSLFRKCKFVIIDFLYTLTLKQRIILILQGMIFLWLTAIIPGATPCDDSGSECKSWNVFQLTLLVSAFGLMSIGAGGIRSASLAFGADQLLKKDNFSDAGILERFLNWYYSACCGAVVVGVLFVVYIQDHFGWKVGFGVSVVLMLLSALSFFSASTLYIKFKAKAGSLIAFAQVLMVSWKKRNLNFSEDELYYQSKGSRLLIPSDKLRYAHPCHFHFNASVKKKFEVYGLVCLDVLRNSFFLFLFFF